MLKKAFKIEEPAKDPLSQLSWLTASTIGRVKGIPAALMVGQEKALTHLIGPDKKFLTKELAHLQKDPRLKNVVVRLNHENLIDELKTIWDPKRKDISSIGRLVGTIGTPANAAWTIRASGYNDGNETFTTPDATQFIMSSSDLQGSGGTTNTNIVTTSFSTVGLTSATIALNHYYRYNSGTDDRAYVEASTNGTTWTALQTFSSTQGTASNFANTSIALTASFLGQSTV